ncbi:MAG: phage/plasmid primase, P4 family [Chlorobiaceae bacterium]
MTFIDEIRNEITRGVTIKDVATTAHSSPFALTLKNEVLAALLSDVQAVDFGDNPRAVDHRIVVVRELLSIADSKAWNLSRRNGMAYVYNGAFWQSLESDDMRGFLGRVALKMGVPSFRADDYKFRDELLKQFQSAAHLSVPEIDPETTLINLANGTYEIKMAGHMLREFMPSDFMTYCLPFAFDEGAECPLFKDYLNRVLPDRESQMALAEYCGYIFVRLKLEKVLLLYGSGANGKSVFYEVLTALLGPQNCSGYSLSSLTDSRSGYHRAKLADKLVNYASEIHGNLQADIFKQLASGEPVEARLPYEHPFIMTNYARLIFNANELPRDVEHSHAFFRRFLIIPFTETIPADEQDIDLPRKIISKELPGVFNWVLQGLNRLLQQRRFSQCKAAERVLFQYQKESDSVAMFLEDRGYKRSAEHHEALGDLYKEYRTFCLDDGFRALGKTKFSGRLKTSGIDVRKLNSGMRAFILRSSMSMGEETQGPF